MPGLAGATVVMMQERRVLGVWYAIRRGARWRAEQPLYAGRWTRRTKVQMRGSVRLSAMHTARRSERGLLVGAGEARDRADVGTGYRDATQRSCNRMRGGGVGKARSVDGMAGAAGISLDLPTATMGRLAAAHLQISHTTY